MIDDGVSDMTNRQGRELSVCSGLKYKEHVIDSIDQKADDIQSLSSMFRFLQ